MGLFTREQPAAEACRLLAAARRETAAQARRASFSIYGLGALGAIAALYIFSGAGHR